MQPDGKVVLGGYFSSIAGVNCGLLARLNDDGSFDSNFLGSTTISGRSVDALAVTSDGKIVVGGDFMSTSGHIGIVRLNSDGSADASFNPHIDGVATTIWACIQGDGKILIGGIFSSVDGSPYPTWLD